MMMLFSMLLVVVLDISARVNASFEVDVMGMKSVADPLKPLLASLAQMTTGKDGARQLGGHDNMSEEDQKALMKCMQACPDLAKMGQMRGGDPDMKMVCDMMKCIQTNDECGVIQKMMAGGEPPAEGECDQAGQMRDGIGCLCGSGCPVSSDMMTNPESMCASWDCWNTKDACKNMLEATPCDPDQPSQLGPVKCICNSATKGPVGKMMGASEMIGAPEGTCHDAAADKEGDVDICALAKDAPDGDCATLMADAVTAMKGNDVCKPMVEMMEKEWTDEQKKCVADIEEAVEAKKAAAEPAGGDSSFAAKAAIPSLAMLAIVGLLRA